MPSRLPAVSRVEPVGNINSSTSPPAYPALSGLAAGDLLVIPEWFAQALGGSQFMTAPAGTSKATVDGVNPVRLGGVFVVKVVNPADFAALVAHSTSTSSRVAGLMVAYRPDPGYEWDMSTLIASAVEWNASAASADSHPAIAARDLRLGIVMSNKSASSTYTTHTATGGASDLVQARALGGASGSQADSTVSIATITGASPGVSFNISQANGLAYSIGVSQVAVAEPTPEPATVYLVDGSGELQAYGLHIIDEAGDPEPIPTLAVMPPAYTVTQFHADAMIADASGDVADMVRMAHRNVGGSLPECTLRGTTYALLRHGVRAIEFSAQLSSDNRFVGSHDATLDRVTALTGNVNAFTWAALQGTLVDSTAGTNTTEPPSTMTLLDDWLAAFPDYVLVVDNKTGLNMTAFFDLLKTVPDWQDHVIVKIDGAAVTSRFQAARDAGFRTMAYWYDTSNWANIPGKMPYVNYPGLNVSPNLAADSYWTDLRSIADAQTAIDGIERPIWAHVLDAAGEAATAASKGAAILQCTAASLFPTFATI